MTVEDSANEFYRQELRERNTPQHAPTAELAKKTVQDLNAEEYHSGKDERTRRTFGRTPDGVGTCRLLSLHGSSKGSQRSMEEDIMSLL